MNSEETQTDKSLALLTWFELNKKRLLYGAVAVLIAGCGIYLYNYMADQKEITATQALQDLNKVSDSNGRPTPPSSAEFLKVAQDYSGTRAAERASIQAASALFAEKKYADAKAKFEQFANDFPNSPSLATAEYGKAACLDALDQPDQALSAYQQIVTRFGSDSVAAQAKIAMGVIYEAKNQPEQALKMYNDVKSNNRTGMYWYRDVSVLEAHLMTAHPELAEPKPAPVTPAVSTIPTTSPAPMPAPPAAKPSPAPVKK